MGDGKQKLPGGTQRVKIATKIRSTRSKSWEKGDQVIGVGIDVWERSGGEERVGDSSRKNAEVDRKSPGTARFLATRIKGVVICACVCGW